jgi:hypothetical protein
VITQQIGKLIGRKRLTEMKTLHLIADKIPQKVFLCLRFHTFGDDSKT